MENNESRKRIVMITLTCDYDEKNDGWNLPDNYSIPYIKRSEDVIHVETEVTGFFYWKKRVTRIWYLVL